LLKMPKLPKMPKWSLKFLRYKNGSLNLKRIVGAHGVRPRRDLNRIQELFFHFHLH